MAELDLAVAREWLGREHRDYRTGHLVPESFGHVECACGNPEPCYERENVLALLVEVERLRAEDRSWADTLMEQRDAAITERDRLAAILEVLRGQR
jgi:hypothetical protein